MNELEMLIPERSIIKGFSGNGLVKITWIKPYSYTEIIKYYVVVITDKSKDLNIYETKTDKDLAEFVITDLNNDELYNIYIYSKNSNGVSEVSNRVQIIPNERSGIKMNYYDKYDNSLNNYYKSKGVINTESNIRRQLNTFQRLSMIQDLKNKIKKDLDIDIKSNNFNINLF